MKFKIIFSGLIVLFVTIGLLIPTPAEASDLRAQKLEKYLEHYNSPLAAHAQILVREADRNKLDYRLLASISGIESTFAQNYIVGSYNAWGWGGGLIYFKSWQDAITQISQGLAQKPYRGTEVEQIAPTYCPPNYSHWSWAVRYFMDQIEQTRVADKVIEPLPLTI